MEVRPDILTKLLCSVCGNYLSCAPIRMKNDGAVLCGRCCDPEGESTLHITPYEFLAEMMLFPCVYKKPGCTKMLPMAEMKDHEEGCEYRPYVCPVTQSGQCSWSGTRKDLLNHYQNQHWEKMLQDPYTIKHEINETNHKSYLLAIFQMLFLVHCKVCITTKSIYHSVRLLGASAHASHFEFALKMLNGKKQFILSRDVAPQGCMALQEDESVHVDFNTLLKFLGDIKDTIFEIKVGRKCLKCECVIENVLATDESWCCKDCEPVTPQWTFNVSGGYYTDRYNKLRKYEPNYRLYGSWYCLVCKNGVIDGCEQHYKSVHSDITYKIGETWRARLTNKETNVLIISHVGMICCDYILNDSKFAIRLIAPVCSKELSKYVFIVKLTNPIDGKKMKKSLYPDDNHSMNTDYYMLKKDFLKYTNQNEIDIDIEINKHYF